MKKMLLLAGVAALFASNASAAIFTPYVSAKAKFSFLDSTVKYEKTEADTRVNMDKNVFGGSVAFGLRPTAYPAIRGELEYNHNKTIKKVTRDGDSRLESHYVLLNAYYDFKSCVTPFTPYIGVGIGGSSIKYSIENVSDRNNRFAWQIGVGTAYDFTSNIAADLGYRFVDLGHFSRNHDGAKTRVDSNAHELYLGLRYTFN